MMLKSKHKIFLLVMTLGIFVLLFTKIPVSDFWNTIKQADLLYLAFAFLVMLAFPLLSAWRWQLIVARLGASLSFWDSFKIVMAAWPIGSVTPAKSGDLVKVLFLKHLLPYSKTTGVILAERLLDVIVLCLFSMVWGVQYGFYQAAIIAAGLFTSVFLFVFLLASPLIHRVPEGFRVVVQNVWEASRLVFSEKRTFLFIFLISACNWFMSFIQTWLCYGAFGLSVPLPYIMAALPIAIFIGLIPITISGMGIRDSAIMYLFRDYASNAGNLAVGILYSIFGYWLLTLLGLFFLKAAFRGTISGVSGKELHDSVFSNR
jgi:glycosyltransferase 2 family protein